MREIIFKYKDGGFKLTPQRLEILKFLDGNKNHPTADDIYRHIRNSFPTVSFATVYNTLSLLCGKRLIIEVTIDPLKKHFDAETRPHHHIVCHYCGRIGDVFRDYSMSLDLPDEVAEEFIITGNHIDFYGTCVSCNHTK